MEWLRLSDLEESSAKKFIEDHRACHLRPYPWYIRLWRRICGKSIYPTNHGHFSYIVNPTSIGIGISIRCNYCGEEVDITDYSVW